MEILAALLTSLLGLAGAPGAVIDNAATDLLRGQLVRADRLEVRVDNTPNFRILQGKVDRIRMAGRGIYILPFLRIDSVDLETDPISIDPDRVRSGEVKLSSIASGTRAEEFDLVDPEITFLDGNRVRLKATVQPIAKDAGSAKLETLVVAIETRLNVVGGTRLELTEPKAIFKGVDVPQQITNAFVLTLNKLLNLRQLEASGITARVLKFEVTQGKMQVIGFARLEAIK
jgi:LmeA-like phospholipid-binding